MLHLLQSLGVVGRSSLFLDHGVKCTTNLGSANDEVPTTVSSAIPQHQRRILRSERNAIAHRVLDCLLPPNIWYVIETAFRIWCLQIDGRRNLSILHGYNRRCHARRSTCSLGMPYLRLQRRAAVGCKSRCAITLPRFSPGLPISRSGAFQTLLPLCGSPGIHRRKRPKY